MPSPTSSQRASESPKEHDTPEDLTVQKNEEETDLTSTSGETSGKEPSEVIPQLTTEKTEDTESVVDKKADDKEMEDIKDDCDSEETIEKKIEKDAEDDTTNSDDKIQEEKEKKSSEEPETEDIPKNDQKEEEKQKEQITDHAALQLKGEVIYAMKVYQKLFDDMNLAQRISQPGLSEYTRMIIMKKLNASTVHIDGYHVRVTMAKTAEDFQNLLNEIQYQTRRVRQSAEINAVLGMPGYP